MNSHMKRYKGQGLGRSRAQELEATLESGYVTSQCGYVHPPESSLNLVLLDFFFSPEAFHVGFQPLSPLWRMGCGVENSRILIMA